MLFGGFDFQASLKHPGIVQPSHDFFLLLCVHSGFRAMQGHGQTSTQEILRTQTLAKPLGQPGFCTHMVILAAHCPTLPKKRYNEYSGPMERSLDTNSCASVHPPSRTSARRLSCSLPPNAHQAFPTTSEPPLAMWQADPLYEQLHQGI